MSGMDAMYMNHRRFLQSVLKSHSIDLDPSLVPLFAYFSAWFFPSFIFPLQFKNEFVGSKIPMRSESCPWCGLQMPLLE